MVKKKLLLFLDEIEKDREVLKKSKDLTEYEQGQLDLIKMIKEIL